MTQFLGQNDVIRQIYFMFKFRNCFNVLATEYPIGFLFIAMLKTCFKSVKFSKKAHLRGKSSKLRHFGPKMTSYVKFTSYLNFKNCFNGLATEYPIRFIFVAMFRKWFYECQVLEKPNLKGQLQASRPFKSVYKFERVNWLIGNTWY